MSRADPQYITSVHSSAGKGNHEKNSELLSCIKKRDLGHFRHTSKAFFGLT
jgi:hypothetical protein